MAKVEKSQILELLKACGVNVSRWGKGETKTIEHLLGELNSGEAILAVNKEGKIIRKITSLYVDILYRDSSTGQLLRLVEDKQVFKDGRVRRRQLSTSLGEKVKDSEDIEEALKRGLQEELQITSNLQIFSGEKGGETRESRSYPGLETCSVVYNYKVLIEKDDYNPDGYIERQGDKTSYFIWQKLK